MPHEMTSHHIGTLLCVVAITLATGYAQDFGYSGELGPNHWGKIYSSCVGKHQSPIDILETNVNLVKLDQLKFENFDEDPEAATLTNNGHTVMFQMKNANMPRISGGPLNGTYEFVQLHFHWGENDKIGSENTINNNSFPMELHIVFSKTSYESFSEALKYHDGLTVLSFLYRVSKANNTNYDGILNVLHEVEHPNTIANISQPKKLNSLLMTDKKQYFTYDGSLTTPPCSEVVTWIEFKNPIELAHEQFELFRALDDEEGKMNHNFRPTQPINDRVIYFNPGDDYEYHIDNKIDNAEIGSLQSDKSGSEDIRCNFVTLGVIFLTMCKM